MKPNVLLEKNMMVRCLLMAWFFMLTPQFAFAEQQFPTREAAVEAMVIALDNQDQVALKAMFGPEYDAFQRGQESDRALQELRSKRFLAALREFHTFIALEDDRYALVVGSMAWPFPIPIVHEDGMWQFDGTAGVEELRNRIVGANELNAIALLDVYAAAQRQYSQADHDGDGVHEYAQRVVSTPGTRDGLYWEADTDNDVEPRSPLHLLKTLSDALLGERERSEPFLGYHFRILYSQGENAKAGAFDYLINGHLLGGFAMLAWPAEYGETGIMSFLVNQDRVIYQADLGAETADIAASITRFDPGPGWIEVPDDDAGLE